MSPYADLRRSRTQAPLRGGIGTNGDLTAHYGNLAALPVTGYAAAVPAVSKVSWYRPQGFRA